MKTRDKRESREEASVDEVAEAIKAAMPALDKTDQRIATAVHRLMSRGEPVDPAAIANAVGSVSVDLVNERLSSWPGVFRDDNGRVVGFWGHAVEKLDPEYRLIADGRTTYAWCALDTLFIPGIIGRAVRVEATDPISGVPVSLVVDRDGAREINPPGALVSMVIPDGPFGYDVIESFCHKVLFFASEATGARWIAQHEDTTLLPVEQAFEVGRVLTERVAPDQTARGDTE
ncbi:MAG TPA: organomercurial lyase [Candidatus Dormibacteraeota bacterium]|nr:organomercurial lyase [Candidatus Dormibacteraeota bacterium]